MEKKNPLSEVLDTSLEKLKKLVDVNTIIGDAITTADGTTIIPVSKVSFGFATGGSELPTSKPSTPFGGGSGGGVTIQPLAFLVISKGNVQLLQMQTADNTADRIVNMVPGVIDKVSGFINEQQDKKAAKAKEEI
ncbi:MAG: GerW family sporulation protein [Oscillospiraceae bacterium]|nr:GerW family sporulation protein [Oscillospiraceae bacterium]MBP1557326.1 GerW family sporulation protein [Oscillospiraceae bacterium]